MRIGSYHLILVISHSLVVFYALTGGLLLYFAENLDTLSRSFQWGWVAGSLVLEGGFLFAYLSKPLLAQKPLARSLSTLSIMLPFIVIQAFFRAPEASEVGVYAVFFTSALTFYDLRRERLWALGSFTGYSALALISQLLLKLHLSIADKTVVAHAPFMVAGWKVLLVVWFILQLLTEIRREIVRQDLMEKEGELRTQQEALIKKIELAREEAEVRYLEAQRLQAQLAREVARTTLAARYEALMRDQYGKPLPDFLRALIEYLHDDLNFVAGLAYQVKDKTYEVVATYALPQYLGRTFSRGLLETAASLKEPYLVAIPPVPFPLQSLANLKPQCALYIPISAEVTQRKVVALIELLFVNEPKSEKIATISELLPLFGTYVWMQLENANIYAEESI